MKKYISILLILLQYFAFAGTKNLSDVKTLKFDVLEKTNINGKKREIKYKIDFKLPNKFRKEVISPELNKGEIYIYDYSKNKKIVYLPIFDETKENSIQEDENKIIKALNKIIKEEKESKDFNKKYNNMTPQTLKIDEQVSIDIQSYSKNNDFIFPETIVINESGSKVGEIKINNIKVNTNIEEGVFNNLKVKEGK